MSGIFRKFDAGKGQRAKDDAGDCQVRALCTALGILYSRAWDLLDRIQREERTAGFNLARALKANDPRLGVTRWLSFPAVRGKPRMTATEFCQQYPRGNF